MKLIEGTEIIDNSPNEKAGELAEAIFDDVVEEAQDEAFKRYKRPVTLIYHDPLNKEATNVCKRI